MTGPEHYKRAEEVLETAVEALDEATRDDGDEPDPADLLAMAAVIQSTATMAQVHATLALAAAVAIQNRPTAADRHAWANVAGDRGGE